MYQLLTGRAGSGKTHQCLQELSEQIQASKNPLTNQFLYILPTLEHRERIVDLLLRRSGSGIFGRHVSTFNECVREWLRLGTVRFASDVTRYLILKELISKTEFDYFKEAAKTNGFVDLISDSIAEFKESLLTPENFNQLIPALTKKFPSAASKYHEIAKIYRVYEETLLKNGLKDSQDALFLLEETAKRDDWGMPRMKHIWIDGFYDFSPLQLAFIQFLKKYSDEMTVTLTVEEGPEREHLFKMPLETKKALIQMGFRVKELPDSNFRTKESALVQIERNLFRTDVILRSKAEESEILRSAQDDKCIQIFEATGLEGEIEMIAREIKRLMQAEPFYYSDIALIFRRVGSYLNIVRSVFERYQIPVEIHEREELRLSPLAQTMSSLFQLYANNWQREHLFNFLKSKFVHVNYEAACQLEMNAMKLGIIHGRDKWLELDFPILKQLAETEDHLRSAGSVEKLIHETKRALIQFGMTDLTDEVTETSRIHHAALKRIFLLLEEIKLKYTENSLTFETFSEILIRLIQVDLFSFHTRDKNKVQIYNISVARQKEYKVVFLPGLLAKQFPMEVREDPVLSDDERRLVNTHCEKLKEKLPRQAVERLLFYYAVTRARERLVLSYPIFNLEGKESLPSFYVDEVKVLFKDEIKPKKQLMSDIIPKFEDSFLPREIMSNAVHFLWQAPVDKRDKTNEAAAIGVYNLFLKNPDFQKVIHSLAIPIESRINDERIKPYFQPKDGIYSPSRVEEYGGCSYHFFANRMLHLEEIEEEIDVRVVGKIFHRVLERFYLWARENGYPNIAIEKAKKISAQYLEEALSEFPLAGDQWYKIELKKKDILETINEFLVQEISRKKLPLEGLIPSHFEYEFGFDPEKNYLVLQTEAGEVKFRGQIDRVDVDPSGKYALVIDYKTGKLFEKTKLNNGIALQLPLYLMAVKQQLGLEPLGGHLYQLSKMHSSGFHHKEHLDLAGITTKKRNPLSRQEWQDLFDKVIRYVAHYVKGIEEAQITVRPRDCADYCPYSSLCRIEKWRLESIYEEIREEDQKLFAAEVKK